MAITKIDLDNQTKGKDFYWDNANTRLALGWTGAFASVVAKKLDVKDAGPSVWEVLSVTQIVDASNTATVTTASPHGLVVGDRVSIEGVTGDSDLNNRYDVLTTPTATTFTITTANVTDATYNNVGITAYKIGFHDSVRVVIGSFPQSDQYGGGVLAVNQAVVGAISAPAGLAPATQAFGVAGYSRSASTSVGAAAVHGWASAGANGVASWGANFGVTNAIAQNDVSSVFEQTDMWGVEVNVDIKAPAASQARGIEIVGSSTVKALNINRAVSVRALGINQNPKTTWDHAFYSERCASDNGIFLDAISDSDGVQSQAIQMRSYNSGGTPNTSTQVLDADGNYVLKTGAPGTLISLQDSASNVIANLSASGHSTPGNWQMQATSVMMADGANHNVVIGGAGTLRVTGPTGVFSVTGFAGGANGRILYLYNASGEELTIENEDSNSTEANRIVTLTGSDVVLRAGNSFATFMYDSAASRWVLVSSN